MKRKIIESIGVFAFLLLCLIIGWQQLLKEQKEAAEKEKMGPCYELMVLSPVTGGLDYIGEPVKWAVEYAQKIINKEGGIRGISVKVTVLDTQFETEQVWKQVPE